MDNDEKKGLFQSIRGIFGGVFNNHLNEKPPVDPKEIEEYNRQEKEVLRNSPEPTDERDIAWQDQQERIELMKHATGTQLEQLRIEYLESAYKEDGFMGLSPSYLREMNYPADVIKEVEKINDMNDGYDEMLQMKHSNNLCKMVIAGATAEEIKVHFVDAENEYIDNFNAQMKEKETNTDENHHHHKYPDDFPDALNDFTYELMKGICGEESMMLERPDNEYMKFCKKINAGNATPEEIEKFNNIQDKQIPDVVQNNRFLVSWNNNKKAKEFLFAPAAEYFKNTMLKRGVSATLWHNINLNDKSVWARIEGKGNVIETKESVCGFYLNYTPEISRSR